MNTLLVIIVLVVGIASLLRSQHMRKHIKIDRSLPERKAIAQYRLDRACEQTTILLKKVTK